MDLNKKNINHKKEIIRTERLKLDKEKKEFTPKIEELNRKEKELNDLTDDLKERLGRVIAAEHQVKAREKIASNKIVFLKKKELGLREKEIRQEDRDLLNKTH